MMQILHMHLTIKSIKKDINIKWNNSMKEPITTALYYTCRELTHTHTRTTRGTQSKVTQYRRLTVMFKNENHLLQKRHFSSNSIYVTDHNLMHT